MNAPPDETLVLDVLYARHLERDGCCNVESGGWCCVRDRGAELIESCGLRMLDLIEHVIRETVEGNCPLDDRARRNEFPGLDSLFRVYFKIATEAGAIDRADALLRELRFGARLVALDVLHRLTFWGRKVPSPLRETIRDISRRASLREREAALKIL